MQNTTVCRGGQVFVGSCRHCRAIAARRVTVESLGHEFLPPGSWPQGPPTGAPSVQFRPAKAPDYGRFGFLRGVAPLVKEVEVSAWGSRSHPYRGIVVRAGSGMLAALVESPEGNNALYVFRADPDGNGWQTDATRTKEDVVFGKAPTFVKRLYHTTSWQRRLTRLLKTL